MRNVCKSAAGLTGALMIFAAVGCTDSRSEAVSTAESASNATVFREHKITDPGMNNIVATTVLIPEGWDVEGGMTRPSPQFYNMPVMLDVRFTAPDGRQVRQYPTHRFEFNNQNPQELFSPTMGGNMYLPLYESPGAWLKDMIRRYPDKQVTDARLVSEEILPDMTEKLRQANAPLYQMVEQLKATGMQSGIYSDFDTQATRLVLQYEQGGQKLEETILVIWQYFVHLVYGQVTGGTWSINQMYSLRGPVGSDYLNDPQLLAILHSARPNPVWLEEMRKHWAEMARIQNQGARQRSQQAQAAHQKRMQTLNETTDIIAGGWKRRNEISDAGHARLIDSIHEVTPYQTPAGETVELPSFYDNVYTDNNGRYLMHNDPNYQPNTDPSVNQRDWERIRQVR